MNWRSTSITTNRGTFECFVAGNGSPLCTAHLYQEFTDAGNPFADVLADYYKVIAVNLKGAGRSSKPRNRLDLSINETVKDLESIRELFGYNKWSYAGHSTGGFLGLQYVTTIPDSLETLILSGTAASRDFQRAKECIYNFRDGYHRKEMTKIWFSMMLPFASKNKKRQARRRLLELSLFRPEKYDEYFSDQHPSGAGIVGKRMRAYVRDLKSYDVRNQLHQVTVPTLILCGAHDVNCPVENSYEMASLLATAKLEVFHESNHFPFIEEQREFRRAIESFSSGLNSYHLS